MNELVLLREKLDGYQRQYEALMDLHNDLLQQAHEVKTEAAKASELANLLRTWIEEAGENVEPVLTHSTEVQGEGNQPDLSSATDSKNELEETEGGRFKDVTIRVMLRTLLEEAPLHALLIPELIERAAKEGRVLNRGSIQSVLTQGKDFHNIGVSHWALADSPLLRGRGTPPRINPKVLVEPEEAANLKWVDCIELILRKSKKPLSKNEILWQLDRAGRPASGEDVATQAGRLATTLTAKRKQARFVSPERGLWTVANKSPQRPVQAGVFDFDQEEEEDLNSESLEKKEEVVGD